MALLIALQGWLPQGGMAAQDEPEYRMEIGGGLALTAYEGDFNGNLLRQLQPMAGAVAKYKMNPRMAWAASLRYGQLKGSSANVETWYPQLAANPIEFTSKVVDFDIRYEYNFWPFGTGREYHGAQPFTPFIALGAGIVWAKPGKQVVAMQTPIGFGVKYKVANRVNLSAEWMMHFSGSDKIDGVKDPYGIKSTGLFKNTDCYSSLQVTITYEFMEKCKTCHNDRD